MIDDESGKVDMTDVLKTRIDSIQFQHELLMHYQKQESELLED
jgi:hypothetical protein